MSSVESYGTRRPVSFTGRSLVNAFSLSAGAYGLFLVVSMLLAWAGSPLEASLFLLHMGAALSLYVYWRLGRWGSAKFDCFGAALLLFGVFLRVQGAIDLLFFGTRVEAIPSTVPLGDQLSYFLIKGEAVTHLGLLLVVSAWRATIGTAVEDFSFMKNYRGVSVRLSWAVYFLGLIVAALVVAGATFGGLTQLAALTYSFSVVSIYFIASRKSQVLVRVLLASALALPMMLLALGSGMKSEIFFPAVPVALLYWFGYRHVLPRAAAVAGGMAVLAFSQLYIQYVREEVWVLEREVSTIELVSSFADDIGNLDLDMGLDAISGRINLTTAHAITVALADSDGHEPLNVFGTIPASFIPRILWPGKPVMQPGIMHTARIYAWNGPLSEINSSTAPGFSAELYLGAGYFGVVLGAFLYGWLLAAAQKFTRRHAAGFGHLAFSFLTVYWALRFDEIAVVYAYTTIVLTVIFALMLSRVGRLAGLQRRASVVQ